MKNLKDSIAWMGIATLIVSCSGDDLQREVPLPVDAIRVAGLQTEELAITTRATTATPAEEIEWLKPQLQEGLNITYWYKKEEATTKKVARLKYADATGYTFHYLNDQGKETTQPAMWYGNGFHRFEGNCVPEQLYSGQLPNDLTIDQSDDSTVDYLGNYTLLERYLSELQDNIVKIQLALPEERELPEGLDILHHSVTGRLHQLILLGKSE